MRKCVTQLCVETFDEMLHRRADYDNQRSLVVGVNIFHKRVPVLSHKLQRLLKH